MVTTTPRLLDVVALLSDLPAQGLRRGQVGTVVELETIITGPRARLSAVRDVAISRMDEDNLRGP